MKYITINLKTEKVSAYNTLEDATNKSIEINRRVDERPSFRLYGITSNNRVIYLGRLMRKFGHDTLFWDKDSF